MELYLFAVAAAAAAAALSLSLIIGVLVEYAPPKELIERNESSLFAQLVAEYWAQAGKRQFD